MLKYFYVAAATLVLAVMSMSGAVAGPQDRSVAPGSFQVAADWDNRVCCERNGNTFWTKRGRCERWGGDRVRDWRCKTNWDDRWDQRWWGWGNNDWDRRICCKRGNRDWWTTARACRDAWGYQTNRRECRDDRHDGDWDDNWDNRWRNWNGDWNRRICCTKGNREWWSTRRDCRDRGGWQTERRDCRNDRDDDDD